MNAPSPILTSKTITSDPLASFLLIILEAINGILGTVAVTSRKAYSNLSAEEKELSDAHIQTILLSHDDKALGFDVEQSLGSGSYNGRGGYYIKMPRHEIRYWGDNSIKAVESAFNEANKLSKEYDFEYQGVTDYEEDPGERSWPASIGLFIKEKENISSGS